MTETTYELYYWPGIQGRGEFVRLALEEAAAPYVDVARHPKGMEALQAVLNDRVPVLRPFAVPALRAGSLLISQTANILQFLGSRHDLAPRDEAGRYAVQQLQLTVSDLVLEAHDTHHPVGTMLYYEDQKREAKRRAHSFTTERMPKYMRYFESVLVDAGGTWLVGGALSYVDLSMFQLIEGLRYAFPRAWARLSTELPQLVALRDRVAARPLIQAYLASPRRLPFNEDGIFRRYPELDEGLPPSAPRERGLGSVSHPVIEPALVARRRLVGHPQPARRPRLAGHPDARQRGRGGRSRGHRLARRRLEHAAQPPLRHRLAQLVDEVRGALAKRVPRPPRPQLGEQRPGRHEPHGRRRTDQQRGHHQRRARHGEPARGVEHTQGVAQRLRVGRSQIALERRHLPGRIMAVVGPLVVIDRQGTSRSQDQALEAHQQRSPRHDARKLEQPVAVALGDQLARDRGERLAVQHAPARHHHDRDEGEQQAHHGHDHDSGHPEPG